MSEARWTVRIDGVLLPGPNALMRMHAQDYRRLRDELLLLARASLEPARPPEPIAHCRLTFDLWRPGHRMLDADAKYGAIKPLLDVLQPDRAYSRTIGGHKVRDIAAGLGLIRDDRDGEGTLEGCVRDLRVRQHVGDARIEVAVVALTGIDASDPSRRVGAEGPSS